MKWFFLFSAVAGGVILSMIAAPLSRRKKIAAEFAAYIKARRPDISINRITTSHIHFQSDHVKNGQIDLHKIMTGCTALKAEDREGRRNIYEWFFNSVLVNDGIETFSREKHAEHILPQLIRAEHLTFFTKRCPMPHRRLDGLPLCILYVADSEQNMQYITEEALRELEMPPGELHELALANLRKLFPEQAVRIVVDHHSMNLIAAHDCYDAARLLLVPGYLNEDEKLLAMIPDRDTLGLAPVPESGDMTGVEQLANTPFNEDKLLINRPILVTRNGFKLL